MQKIPRPAILFLILLPVIITDITGVRSWKNVINSDGYGYYAYLPCVFLYHHFDFERAKTEEIKVRDNLSKDEAGYPFIALPGDLNTQIDKYPIGVAMCILPFFLLACLFSYLSGFDMSGYSVLFQESVVLAAFFYLLLGLIFCWKLLQEYEISERSSLISLIIILYGTNLFYYATAEPSLSHVYSFGFGSLFLFSVKKAMGRRLLKDLVLISVSLGLLLIIRPTNIIYILALPFIAGNVDALNQFSKRTLLSRISPLLLFAGGLIVLIQLTVWKVETGKWFIWSYGEEGFNFFKPHIIDILFSYRKGFFVYTPVMFVVITGSLLYWLKAGKFYVVLSIVLFFGTVVYLSSCWWQWWYGGSFGIRPLVDFYPFFILLLGLLLSSLGRVWRIATISVCALCIIVSVVQTIQYEKFIFSFDKMNKHRYWEIFMKTEDKYGWLYENPSSKLSLFQHPSYPEDFIKDMTDNAGFKQFSHTGMHSLELTAAKTKVVSISAHALSQLNNVWIYEKLWGSIDRFPSDAGIMVEVRDSNGKTVYNNVERLENSMGDAGEWDKIEFIKELPALSADDSIVVSVQCSGGKACIDDVAVKFGIKK